MNATFGRSKPILAALALGFGWILSACAQPPPPLPPLPRAFPPLPTNGFRTVPVRPPYSMFLTNRAVMPPSFIGPLLPSQSFAVPAPAVPAAPAQPTLPANSIAWDSESKEVNTKEGDAVAQFTFWLTNVCKEDVIITSQPRTSCGCTVATLPQIPWRLAPGSNGPIQVTLSLAGKFGSIIKTVTVDSNAGTKNLMVRANMPAPAPAPIVAANPAAVGQAERTRNMQVALANRQAVFKGDCASCHAQPAVAKMGRELYTTACAICHNAVNRATSVPDLQALNKPTDAQYWRGFIVAGKEKTMMPAFASDQGGFLTPPQIDSLVAFLVNDFPKEAKIVFHDPARSMTPPAAAPPLHPPGFVPPPAGTPPGPAPTNAPPAAAAPKPTAALVPSATAAPAGR